MREVIHGKMLWKQTISITLHDINIYFPRKRVLKTDSVCVIVGRRLAPRQGNHGSITEFKTCAEPDGLGRKGGNNANRTEASEG